MKRISILFVMACVTMALFAVQPVKKNNRKEKSEKVDSVAIILEQARKGNAAAQNTVGLWYYTGKDTIKQDYQKALEWWDECIAAHKAAGIPTVVMSYSAPLQNEAELKTMAAYLNAIGEKCYAVGIKFGYHSHSHEFKEVAGTTMMDYYISNTKAENVFYQMDVYWAVRGQVSPVEYFKKYPGRFTLLHIKDHKEFGESGMVGFDAIFNNADVAGLKALIVELEGSNRPNILDGMKVCADYLKAAKFVKASYDK